MRVLQDLVAASALNPIDTNGATTNGTGFDVSPYSHVAVFVQTGNVAANVTTLKIEQSDNNSSWSDLTGYAWTNPTAASGDNKVYAAYVECGGATKRYLRVTVTGGAGATLVGGVWLGANAHQTPSSATERGVAEQLMPST